MTKNRNYTYARSFVAFNSIPNSVYYLQKYNIPGFSITSTEQSTMYQTIPIPGNTITYNAFNATFILDEDMKTFVELFNWINTNNTANQTGDFSLYVYNNTAQRLTARFDFFGGWITQMNDVMFVDSTNTDDTNPRLIDCLFNYAYYNPVLLDDSVDNDIIVGVE